MRWKALAEIYTMHSFAQLCNLNFFFFAKMLPKILLDFAKFRKFNLAKFLKMFANFGKILANF